MAGTCQIGLLVEDRSAIVLPLRIVCRGGCGVGGGGFGSVGAVNGGDSVGVGDIQRGVDGWWVIVRWVDPSLPPLEWPPGV